MPKNNKLNCSNVTQQKIADSLKQLMDKTPFEKISISDITNNCSIHRQTFYYHFTDKYELLGWIFSMELIEPFIKDFTFDNLYEHLEAMFTTMKNSERFYKNAFRLNADEVAFFINQMLSSEFSKIVRKVEEDNHNYLEGEFDERITTLFLGYGIAGVVINWAQQGMKESPQELTESLRNVMSHFKRIAAERI